MEHLMFGVGRIRRHSERDARLPHPSVRDDRAASPIAGVSRPAESERDSRCRREPDVSMNPSATDGRESNAHEDRILV